MAEFLQGCNKIEKAAVSFRNRNLKKSLYLLESFNFNYAGKAQVFITFEKNNYILVVSGVNIVGDLFLFSPHVTKRYKFEKLYYAILAFQSVIRILCSSLEWYYEGMFDNENFYNESWIFD